MQTFQRILAAAALLAALGLFAGCESDATAPDEALPPVGTRDAATQAGAVAAGVARIGPAMMTAKTTKQVVTFTWAGDRGLTGSVFIDFRDAPDGNPAAPDAAAWARLYTEEGAPVVFTMPDLGGQTAFALDIAAALDQVGDTATILAGSGGSMTSGEYTVGFTMAGVVVGGTGYPTGGMTVTSGSHTVDVNFDGDATANVIVDGGTPGAAQYTVDLDTGEITEVNPS